MKRLICMWVFFFVVTSGHHSVMAQFLSVPLYYGATNSVKDEVGFILPGTAAEPGTLVQVLQANFGKYAPSLSGEPHPLNPVISQIYIGQGVDPTLGPIGKFSGSVSINRYIVTPMFVRVYNRKTIGESSFYCDSQIYSNSVTTYGVFIAKVNSTIMPIDPADDDGDQLSNSWEKSIGTNPAEPDTDGDGFLDGMEVLAGTDPLNGDDFLRVLNVRSLEDDQLDVTWPSVAGKLYQVEYSTDIHAGEESFEPYGEPTEAADALSAAIISNAAEMPNAVFRVRLILP